MPETLSEKHPPMPLDKLVPALRAFHGWPLDEQKAFISHLVDRHPIENLAWGKGWRYRRARTLAAGELPANVDNVIWRKDVPAKLGRANPPGFSLLYLADRLDTALTEVEAAGRRTAIAEFSIREGRSIRICPIGEMIHIHRTGRGRLAGDASQVTIDLLNACRPDDHRAILITDAFLLERFSEPDSHELSSHIAHCIYQKLPGVTAIAFQSVQQQAALNFAVRVDRFWDSWGLYSTKVADVEHLAMGFHRLTNIRHVSGVYPNGDFVWTDGPEPENETAPLSPLWTPSEQYVQAGATPDAS